MPAAGQASQLQRRCSSARMRVTHLPGAASCCVSQALKGALAQQAGGAEDECSGECVGHRHQQAQQQAQQHTCGGCSREVRRWPHNRKAACKSNC